MVLFVAGVDSFLWNRVLEDFGDSLEVRFELRILDEVYVVREVGEALNVLLNGLLLFLLLQVVQEVRG